MAPSRPAAFAKPFVLRTFANPTATSLAIEKFGVTNANTIRNLSYDEIAAHKAKNGEGQFVKNGTYTIDTGKFTGSSPKNKYIMDQAPSSQNIWWGDINHPERAEVFDELYETVTKHYSSAEKVFVAFKIENDVVIGGTWYRGEKKKGIFLPLDGIMAMHCAAKTRYLIGDDEHGWDDEGIFNFEGGCYAKTVNLSQENEPDIYNTIKRDALLENAFVDAEAKEPDFYNTSRTENGRVSYPIYHILNHEPTSSGGHPSNIACTPTACCRLCPS
ncbi:hypothetical protein PHYSODRAFT_254268 [Phytophthora sojae]|uniref:phosphoenolpyruvate carboxykinase (ATP) n=1 Tax=Phytophthora sojae (strain P6497) TaxID=1094619 RepID=G5AIF6_PHYSP|nr:hypothetical protein PHYSODRAFT_254268 [Phytophthora sojae]EGZ04657.1 hypothetical protein PHYSODRAFT_254268 [Phytophthora sojae]|eukprot:XP_009539857.1 hypothetical protein PHYSODRAFT_254268 [Phytophthora sojae]